MNKKLIFIVGGFLALIIIIIIISLIIPKENNNQAGPYITNVVFAKGEDENKNPINPTNVFSVNDNEIHAIIYYSNLPSGSSITYQWYDIQNNKILKEDVRPQLRAIYTGLGSAILTREDRTDWGVGTLRFVVLFNKNIYYQKDIEVKTDADIQREGVFSGIKSIVLTKSVDLLGNPVNNTITDVFSKDDPRILVSFSFQGLPIKAEMEARWRYIPEERLISIYNKTLQGSGTFSFGINASRDSWLPTKKWALGKYELEIFLNGDLYKEIEFNVE